MNSKEAMHHIVCHIRLLMAEERHLLHQSKNLDVDDKLMRTVRTRQKLQRRFKDIVRRLDARGRTGGKVKVTHG